MVVFRDKAGTVGHIAVGSALLDADWGAALSMLPSDADAEGLTDFFCDTPAQAERAMAELAEIGDVPFHPRDFAPRVLPSKRQCRRWLAARQQAR